MLLILSVVDPIWPGWQHWTIITSPSKLGWPAWNLCHLPYITPAPPLSQAGPVWTNGSQYLFLDFSNVRRSNKMTRLYRESIICKTKHYNDVLSCYKLNISPALSLSLSLSLSPALWRRCLCGVVWLPWDWPYLQYAEDWTLAHVLHCWDPGDCLLLPFTDNLKCIWRLPAPRGENRQHMLNLFGFLSSVQLWIM